MLIKEFNERKSAAQTFHLSSSPPSGWDSIVAASTDCIFHQSLWGRTLEQGYHSKILYAYLAEDSRIVVGLMGIVFNFGFFRLFFSTVPYGGFIGDFGYREKLLECLEPELLRRGIHQIRITRLHDYHYPDLLDYRVNASLQHSLGLDGRTPESLWRSYRKNTRRDINKAKRLGVSIRVLRGKEELSQYYRLYEMTMKRNRSLKFYPRALYQSLYKHWISQGSASILFADYGGQHVAGILLLFSRNRTYLLGSVSSDEYLKYCPNDLLLHTAIERSIASGHNFFDFMMSNSSDIPLMKFKEKWGAQPYPFCIFEKDLVRWRPKVWRILWKILHSKIGSRLIGFL